MNTTEPGLAFTGKWVPVSESLPTIGKVNGFWWPAKVIVARSCGRVNGAIFTYSGGDNMDLHFSVGETGELTHEAQNRKPFFLSDTGSAYDDVQFWAYVPEHPTIKRPRTYA